MKATNLRVVRITRKGWPSQEGAPPALCLSLLSPSGLLGLGSGSALVDEGRVGDGDIGGEDENGDEYESFDEGMAGLTNLRSTPGRRRRRKLGVKEGMSAEFARSTAHGAGSSNV